MVAVVNTSPSLNDAFNYNEKKVKQGVAEFIHAANYPKDTEHLRITEKLMMLKNQAALNEGTDLNAIHISLNFHPSENLDKEKLKAIADSYMEKIGFGQQPYLVYQHNDAGHPHIHIVSTNIKADGRSINTYNIGKWKSSPARLEVEKEFGLVKASGRGLGLWEMPPLDIKKLQYGKSETKSEIAKIVNYVTKNYKFSSVTEYNAVLNQLNVFADAGEKGSRLYKNGGLVYSVLDENGKRIGVPVNSSSISTKPTLKKLNILFGENKSAKEEFKSGVRTAIDLAILQNPGMSLTRLAQELESNKIHVVLNQNDQGLIYGITYVDHENKVVFKGSELGKKYSARGMQDRCRMPELKPAYKEERHEIPSLPKRVNGGNSPWSPNQNSWNDRDLVTAFKNAPSMDSFFVTPDFSHSHKGHNQVSFEFSSTKKKKRKKRN